MTADGTYATQSALSTPGITSLVKKDDEKRSHNFCTLMFSCKPADPPILVNTKLHYHSEN